MSGVAERRGPSWEVGGKGGGGDVVGVSVKGQGLERSDVEQ